MDDIVSCMLFAKMGWYGDACKFINRNRKNKIKAYNAAVCIFL